MKYIKCDCPDEEIYLRCDVPYYDLYLKEPYVAENTFLQQKRDTSSVSFAEAKDRLPVPYWEGHSAEIEAYWRAWELAFAHIRPATEQNGFVNNYIDTAFNGNTFITDSPFMMQFCKYAADVFDFRGTMNNFYSKQHLDGFICREICSDTGADRFHRFDPIASGMNICAWTEWELFQFNGDRERLKRIFPVLMAYHRWLKKYHRNPDGSYWCTGLGSTMDNQPRVPEGFSRRLDSADMVWMDANLLALIDCERLLWIAKEIGRGSETAELEEERVFLREYIRRNLWDEEEGFFFDRWPNGERSRCKSIGAFWALHADLCDPEQTKRLVEHLKNPEEFNRFHPFPSISADSPLYNSNGLYWRGGVWACMNYMVFRGLERNGFADLAREFALRSNQNAVEVYKTTGTFWECYAPDSNEHSEPSVPDCVGWSGLYPITFLLEQIFGMHVLAAERKVVWQIALRQTFGVTKLPFLGGTIDLRCEYTKNDCAPRIYVRTDQDFCIELIMNGAPKEIPIKAGTAAYL